ncbi:MAG: hypothetical protein WC292_02650 [Clostridia bacterium]
MAFTVRKKRIVVIVLVCVLILGAAGGVIYGVIFAPLRSEGQAYTIPLIDLSESDGGVPPKLKYLYETVTVDDSADYLAHPDSIGLKNGNILVLYPEGHGKGAIRNKISTDSGATYGSSLSATPQSWEHSRETPTVYRLNFTDREDMLIMISANPRWFGESTTGGFNCSLSQDEGQNWTEFELFYPKNQKNGVVPIVAMASLTRLKENGKFADKWMGLFHDASFNNYKTILTFDENGKMCWSVPEKYFVEHRVIERKTNMCEVEVIRSDGGNGDELCLITRSNTKKYNSLLSFSRDEGKSWTAPIETPAALSGERHKAEYTADGRLIITFRSVCRDKETLNKINKKYKKSGWYSEGAIAWVGTYEDLKMGREGQYRIKLAHTYFDTQTTPQTAAHHDTGYCGNTVLEDDSIIITIYGKFDPNKKAKDGSLKTYIVSKRLNLEDIDELYTFILATKNSIK